MWLSRTALLYYRTVATCLAMSEVLQTVSHDRLTRMLQADWSGAKTPGEHLAHIVRADSRLWVVFHLSPE